MKALSHPTFQISVSYHTYFFVQFIKKNFKHR